MRIIAYQTSIKSDKVLLEESTGEFVLTNNLEEIFSFLLEEYDDTIRICWELDITVALIIKLLPRDKALKLRETHKCYLPPFNMFYVPGKVLSIGHIPSHTRMSLYEVAQYFPELPGLDNISEVQMLGVKLMYELDEMNLHPTKLTSPVAIYEECMLSKMDLPTVADMPIQAAEMAYKCSGRLWIESHQLGRWETTYDYDLTSAFPSVACNLIDTRQCDWINSKEYQSKAVYGYAKCKITIYDWVMVSPILKEDDNGSQISPVGTWEDWLTKGELDFIKKWGIGTYEILDGWWAIAKVPLLRKPLINTMTKLLTYKDRTGLQASLAKRMSTGIYGKFGEERLTEFGKHFNPCYFAEISTQTRLKVAEFLYAYNIGAADNKGYRTLLHIGVDGVLLTEPVDGLVKKGKAATGKWRLSYSGEALVFSSGLVYTKTTKPKGLTLLVIKKMIEEHPKVGHYETRLKRRLTLADALVKDRLQDIGKEIELSSSIDFYQQQHDRVFPKVPKTGEQLIKNKYNSRPIEIT